MAAMSVRRVRGTFTALIVLAGCGAVSGLAAPLAAAAQSGQTAPVTFAKDVAPILQRSCQSCHRPGEIAPMSLVTYQDVRPWARAIKTRVASREMPPFHVDRTIGIQQFKDDPSLSDAEIATIVRWVDSGAPLGNQADMPPPRSFAQSGAWQFEPDLIVDFPTFRVPAKGPDLYGDLFADIAIDGDRYIKGIQTRSVTQESHKVMHHALSYAVPPARDEGDAAVQDGGQFLVEYASGKNAEVFPEGTGVLLQKGQRARLNYHLHAIGENVDARVQLGLSFYPKGYVPKYIRRSRQLAPPTTPLDIPAGTVARSDGYTKLHTPVRLVAFQPHMHNLGSRQCLEVLYPTSGSLMQSEMLNCAYFNNNWHLTYNYTDEAQPLLPAGTILHNIQWHDNTSANPRALDPKNWVGDGQRTIDEMGFFWIGWVELTEEEYTQQLAARTAARRQTQQQQP